MRKVLPPPMGWNTWDCYGSLITEEQVKANAERLARDLLPYGWQYAVIDINWYEPVRGIHDGLTDGGVRDEFGRYLPAPNRFPSSAGGAGFKPLADFIHGLGLKFGLHIMRGIPRAAVEARQPIAGSDYTADQVADVGSTCVWNSNNYGINMRAPGAQAYYDSIVQLYARWGVDFIKADDMVRAEEIEGLARAMDCHGPEMVLSLVGVTEGAVLGHPRATMYRIGTDVWDHWDDPNTIWVGVQRSFDLCAKFAPAIAEGSYPDADMLPLGRIGKNDAEGEDRETRLTPVEQVTMMTLWSIFRSPLMFGGSLTEMDPWTLSLLTNPEVLAVNQRSRGNRPVYTEPGRAVWAARDPESDAAYVALFNRSDAAQAVGVDLGAVGIAGRAAVRDLWQRSDSEPCEGALERVIEPHGSRLLKLTPERRA